MNSAFHVREALGAKEFDGRAKVAKRRRIIRRKRLAGVRQVIICVTASRMGRQKDWPAAARLEIRRMGRVFFARLIVCAILAVAAAADRVYADPATLEPAPLDAAESARALAEIQARGAALYRRYSGIQSTRRLIAEERDPESGALLHTSRVLMERTDHFYGRPDVRVLEYELDGRTMDPESFRLVRIAPPLPPFDENGPENYESRITGLQRMDGRICYRVEVTPKKARSRICEGVFILSARRSTWCTSKAASPACRRAFARRDLRFTLPCKTARLCPAAALCIYAYVSPWSSPIDALFHVLKTITFT
jgi:hypothetical protein